MYFNGSRKNTSIDDELDDGNLFVKVLNMFSNYKKIILISLIVLILLIMMLLFFINRKIEYYLVLNGEDEVIIYQGTDYIESGYSAYNSKNDDLSHNVIINSNLNNDVVGEYEIVYTFYDIVKTRVIKVIDKQKEYTFIHLNSVDNSIDVYLKKGDQYIEPGYSVFTTTGKDLNNQVEVTGNVDTSQKGVYKLTYSVVDLSGVTISVSRKVIVMDSDISLTLNTEEYTNRDVIINVSVVDEYFDYMILPNRQKVTSSIYSYDVSENGMYTFKVYNKRGSVYESSIDIKNIDKVSPNGSCKISYDNNGSIIKIDANDVSGIKKYVYNNKEYLNNNINLSNYVDSAKVLIYDNAGNSKEVSCKADAIPFITDIKNEGIIVTVNAKKVGADISGYYFSYTNERPNKESGGYLATSNESVDVVRLTGTTYVWVEDKAGKISKPAMITINSSDYPETWSGYSILKGTKLKDYLSNKGTTLDEFNKLMSRSVRAAGLGTKEGSATAAAALTGVLAYKYKIKLPYWRGGKTNSWGAYSAWGMYRENPTFKNQGYDYYGMDCDGFVNWSYQSGGNNYTTGAAYYSWRNEGLSVSRENGDIGDVMVTNGHVKIIIGKTDDSFIIAEAYGVSSGIIISRHAYTSTNNYTIIRGEDIIRHYGKTDVSEYDKNMPAF